MNQKRAQRLIEVEEAILRMIAEEPCGREQMIARLYQSHGTAPSYVYRTLDGLQDKQRVHRKKHLKRRAWVYYLGPAAEEEEEQHVTIRKVEPGEFTFPQVQWWGGWLPEQVAA